MHVLKHHVVLHDDVCALSFYVSAKINLKEKLSGLIQANQVFLKWIIYFLCQRLKCPPGDCHVHVGLRTTPLLQLHLERQCFPSCHGGYSGAVSQILTIASPGCKTGHMRFAQRVLAIKHLAGLTCRTLTSVHSDKEPFHKKVLFIS